jgi:hypothetical protein
VQIFIEKARGLREFRRPRHRREENINMDLREIG